MKFTIKQLVKKNLKSLSSKGGAIALFFLLSLTAYGQDPATEESEGFTVDKIVAKVDNYIRLFTTIDNSILRQFR